MATDRVDAKQVITSQNTMVDAIPKQRLAKYDVQNNLLLSTTKGYQKLVIKVSNNSEYTWSINTSNEIRIGYSLYKNGMKAPIFFGLGDKLSSSLSPGQSAELVLNISVPSVVGHYQINIDLLENNSTWFLFATGIQARIDLEVQPVLVHKAKALFAKLKKA
jgi:hypothetical protein